MKLTVISNPNFQPKAPQAPVFTRGQFSRLVNLHARALGSNVTRDYKFDSDNEAAFTSFTFYKAAGQSPLFQLHARQDEAARTIYEVFQQGKGRIAETRNFDQAIEALEDEMLAPAA